MSIHILPPEVASQIAAGEVIERPASVVKECLENALDAGAHWVSIKVEGAGRRLIEISDDGCGIPAGELALAVERHATSKLSRAEDLFRIGTLGFRGEALASIGSVSRLTITSRVEDESAGARLRVEGGKNGVVESIGTPVGTTVRVEDLFYNVPARLKFLKQDATERQQIDALVTRYALAYPHVRFKLTQEGKTILQTAGNGDRREILANLYGVEIARQMLEVLTEEDGLRFTGFISPTSLTRSNRRELTFFINGRWVQDASVAAALLHAYHTLLMVGRYPIAIIFIELPADSVDVNVHPAKAEVRFKNPDTIFSSVQRAVRRALLAYTPIPQVSPAQWRAYPLPDDRREIDPAWGMASQLNGAMDGVSAPDGAKPDSSIEAGTETGSETQAQPIPLPTRLPLLRLVGQVGATYLVAEAPDGLYLIDQHAAHERVLFERFMTQRQSSIQSQSLLEPATLQLTPQAARLLEEQLSVLEQWGFRVEPFGPNTFLVRSIPALLGSSDPATTLQVLVEDFEEDETPLQTEIEARIIARICKRSAVKAGQVLMPQEQIALLEGLESCQSPRTCPHGRPTMIHLSVDLLERQFGRRGAR
jgi:DNA mismatch repair protein MutL